MKALLAPILACALAQAAQADSFQCRGNAPDWQLTIDGDQAHLVFPTTTEMEVMLITTPEGQDWPRAFTLIGSRDTAIVLLEQEACESEAYRARVLTQRGQTPILLTGCCTLPPG